MSVGRLSLGTAQLGKPYGIASAGALSEGEVTSVLQAAVDLGITAIDTAPGFGLAEQRVGAFLSEHGLVSDISVCTKLPSVGAVEGNRLEYIVEERLVRSLQRLRCDCVDCYLIEDIADLRTHGERLVDALARQQDKGRALDIGISVYDPADLATLADYPSLNVVQHPFNLVDRRLLADDWLEKLRFLGAKVHIRSVLLRGLLAMDLDAVPDSMAEARAAVAALRDFLAERGLSLPEAAVAFAIALDADRVIVAAESARQLEQLLGGVELELPDGFADALEAQFAGLPRTVYDPRAWPEST